MDHLPSSQGFVMLTDPECIADNDLMEFPDETVYNEVVVETDSSQEMEVAPLDDVHVGEMLPQSGCDAVEMNNSLLFQRNGTMQTVTQLIGQHTQTSLEHVNDIIKHGDASVVKAISGRRHSTTPLSPDQCEKSKNTVHKVIVIKPEDDAELVTAEAISAITENLNREAAQKLAEGKTPDKETVIEITRINTRGEIYKGNDIFPTKSQRERPVSRLSPVCQMSSSPEERKHHRRKSPHPKKYMYHTPSPPQAKSRRHVQTSLNADCYFESKPRATTQNNTASSKLLGYTTPRSHASVSQAISQRPNVHTQLFGTAAKVPGSSASHAKKPSILRNIRQTAAKAQEPIEAIPAMPFADVLVHPSSVCIDRSDNISSSAAMEICDTDVNVQIPSITTTVSEPAVDLDSSLSNIQWLSQDKAPAKQHVHRDVRVIASEKQIDEVSRECGRKKRPPYAYMHLIQMAICSSEKKKMTLKEIYTWIEDKFPFYKYSPNQGWKNSIRHNLSMYDIFVRDKTPRETQGGETRGKTVGSYWSLRPDLPVNSAKYKGSSAASSSQEDKVQNSSQSLQNSSEDLQINSENLQNSSEGLQASSVCLQTSSLGLQNRSQVLQNRSQSRLQSLQTSSQESTDSGYLSQSNMDTTPSVECSPSVPTVPYQQIIYTGSKKRGPVPLLPKPPVMQTYALIPIQDGVPVIPQQPIMVSSVATNPNDIGIGLQNAQITQSSRARPASATEFLKSNISRPPTTSRTSSKRGVKRPGSAFELIRSVSLPEKSKDSVLELLAKETTKPQGMTTPPPSSSSAIRPHMAPKLKRCNSPVRPSASNTVKTKSSRLWQHSKTATATVTSASSEASSSEFSGNTAVQGGLTDSGFMSDSTNDQTASTESSLPKPVMYFSANKTSEDDGCLLTSTPSNCGSEVKSAVVSVDCSTDQGLHDILSSIEKSLSSPMRNLLRTPPKSSEKSMLTSTPFKLAFGSPAWSPIKGFTPIAGDPSLEGTLFTPLKDGKAVTSTPTSNPETIADTKLETRTPDSKKHTFQYPLYTPLKTPFKWAASSEVKSEKSPGDIFGNQSFSKLLGELQFESMIDDGINMDVSNMSFSALQ